MYQFDNTKFFFLSVELTLNPPEGIIAGPLDEENFFEWEAYIMYVYTCICTFSENMLHVLVSRSRIGQTIYINRYFLDNHFSVVLIKNKYSRC